MSGATHGQQLARAPDHNVKKELHAMAGVDSIGCVRAPRCAQGCEPGAGFAGADEQGRGAALVAAEASGWAGVDPNAYALRCVGDAMAPRFRHGELVIASSSGAPEPGDDGGARLRDGRKILRSFPLYRAGGRRVLLTGPTDDSPPELFEDRDVIAMHPVIAITKPSRWPAAPLLELAD